VLEVSAGQQGDALLCYWLRHLVIVSRWDHAGVIAASMAAFIIPVNPEGL
jgi:hypothetical protein